MIKKIILGLVLLCSASAMQAARFYDNLKYDMRLCYALGGTAPVGLPATIRGLNSYELQPNFSVGVDVEHPIDNRWGILVGLHLENKGMDIDVDVKNYHMEIVRGGEKLAGMFTGRVSTHVHEWMYTVPLQVAYHPTKNVRVKFGPYLSLLTTRIFDGMAHDGYLRLGDPTGQKVELGNDESSRGSYDFSEHMRRMQYGLDLTADWYLGRKLGVTGGISWGLTGVHHSSFKTIEQTLYPIFGSLGVTYRLN